MIYRQKKTSHLATALLLIIVFAIIISNHISIPLQISTFGEVFPKSKWILTRGNGGQLISQLIDYTNGYTTKYDIIQFERGEFISLDHRIFNKKLNSISEGDTLFSIKSSFVLNQLIEFQGELEVAIANLKSQRSVQKEALIKEAENRILYTKEKLIAQNILFDRTKKLFEKGLSSQQEFEQQKFTLNLLNIENDIYTAQLENLKTGVKPEEIEYLESQVSAAANKLDFIKTRKEQLTIISPISGTIVSSFSTDTLLVVSDTEKIILHAPVKLDQTNEFKVGQVLPIKLEQFDNHFSGTIVAIDKIVRIISGEQTISLSILIDNKAKQILPGMLVQNKLKLREITLWQYFKRMLNA